MAQTQTGTGTIAGYFEDHSDARKAVEALRDAGFTSAHIGVAHRGASSTTTGSASHTAAEAGHKAGEKTAGAWESIKHFFGSDEAEPYADERTQGDLANREVTPNPADAGRYGGQYDPSDLHQSFTGLSVPEDRSRYFAHRFGKSEKGAIVTVNAGDRASEAGSILTRYGADLGNDATNYDYSQNYSQNHSKDSGEQAQSQPLNDAQNNIQLLGEVLRVHKDRISRGEVILRKETITETQNVQVPVSREELVIERRAVDGNTPASGSIGDNSEIRIPLTEERASVDKSTVVREEVAVGKKSVEQVRDLSGDVRHEELVVDDETRDNQNRKVS